ncbi:MAG TPA: addiction module toxin RelE [Lachnospiraceae bacterium]|jgi:plasmid stabilization system protein ParE|uniref:ParE-like toxin of type II ParDE toxin-antitoxin system n=1 Tax=Muricomes intestini TaxID=1796634 RepID=A0A4R3KG51_9FIRM|nr:type II toxin-antitoxin system RelE/ParE family toxin [Muricomes intestini]TCS82297.1 ParE-like toxin of type II ParDE toxin-antitoxin system [Muricomes intestini]HAX53743.1 addiction module toxin RelE [Lachnospiraceae bacterium]HBI74478.1 addiction module toxin RelE [Lachnospiraceae bacterium]HCR84690.1 addiction module toxin RelE [Lachnospiraceae bacterium]
MKQYLVQITDEALQDMENLYNHIALKLFAPENAIGQYNRIADEILKLDSFPERFEIIDVDLGCARELRRMPVDNYSVFYVIKGDSVIVTDVLYSASDISKRLK